MATPEAQRERSSGFPWAYLAVLLVIAGTVVAWTARALFRDGGARPVTAAIDGLPWSEKSARRAPDFRIRTLDGRQIALSDFRGKVLILDFWATWCPPCREEIPLLVRLKKEYGEHGVEILGLTVEDPESDADTVREFAREFGVNYIIGFAPEGMLDVFAGPGENPIPQTFVFDRQGRLREHLVGYDPLSDGPRLRSALARILSE